MATRMAAMTICVAKVSQKPQPAALPIKPPAAPPTTPSRIVIRQPMGCMLGTRIRAMRPMTMPAPRPDQMLSISTPLSNHYVAPVWPSRANATTLEMARKYFLR